MQLAGPANSLGRVGRDKETDRVTADVPKRGRLGTNWGGKGGRTAAV